VRVLVIAKDFPTPELPYAGVFVLRQAQALARLGHSLLVVRVVPHAPPLGEKWRHYRAMPSVDEVEGIPVRTIRAFFLPRMLASEYLPQQVGAAVARIANEFRADIVHSHYLIPCGQIAVRQSLPSVVTAHGADAYDWAWRRPGLRRAATEAVLRADCVVAVSHFIRERIVAVAGNRHIDVVYNGADDDVFFPADRLAARRELGIDASRFVVAFAGRPSHEKGAFDLLEAAARLREIQPLLLVAGPGPDREFGDAIARLGVDARVLGLVSHAKLARVLAASDAFCLPSYEEGLPAAICEAMLSGRPVVATPVGGVPEIIKDAETGFLVPIGNPRILAHRLHEIALAPELGRRLGNAAHAFARPRLTWETNARHHETLYLKARATSASAMLG